MFTFRSVPTESSFICSYRLYTLSFVYISLFVSAGFFITENPSRAAFTAKDYTPIAELLKKAANYTPLPIECVELDGDINSIPLVFEDQFNG